MSPRNYKARQMASPAFAPNNYKNSIAGQKEKEVEQKLGLFCEKLKNRIFRRHDGQERSLDPQSGQKP